MARLQSIYTTKKMLKFIKSFATTEKLEKKFILFSPMI